MTKIKGFRMSGLDQLRLRYLAEAMGWTQTETLMYCLRNIYENYREVGYFRVPTEDELIKEIVENHQKPNE